MKQLIKPLAVLVAFAVLAVPRLATAQPASAIPPTITTAENTTPASARWSSSTCADSTDSREGPRRARLYPRPECVQ